MNMKAAATEQNNLSLQTIIAISIIIIAIISASLVSIIVYINLRQNLEDQFSKRVLNIATLTALAQDGNDHSLLMHSSNEDSSNYQKIKEKNLKILNSDPIISAIYTMRQDESENIYFVIYVGQNKLSQQAGSNPKLGDIFKNASPLLKKEFSTLNNWKVEENQYINQSGSGLSVYVPFYLADGKTREGVIGIDINKDALITTETNALILIASIFVLLIPVLVIAGWIISIRLTLPITDITKTVLNMSSENFSQTIISSDFKETNQLGQAINSILLQIDSSFLGIRDISSKSTNQLQEQTKKLEKIIIRSEKQASQLKALAFVARSILSVQNIDNLLFRIATSISESLSFHHMGIFLLDDAKEYAILTATNSAEGQKMMERNHRLKVGDEGIVGYVAGIARPHIADDTAKDIVFLANPDLPETQSELAVPLKIGLDNIGVLDVQSKDVSAFSEEDIEIFSILADYISIAIQNARRFQEIQKTITESDTLYRNYLRQEWKSFANQRRNPGYIYNISGSKPIIQKLETIEIQKTIQSGKPTISQQKAQSHLSVPIKLRGQVIGIINIQSGGNHEWEEDEIDIMTAVADRVGLAVENARLLEDSQSRAARERTISDITSKIGASINIRNVLQTAVEELGHILPGSDVIIQLKDTKNKD